MIIILDRDGVINFDSPDYIKSPDEWIPIPGSLEAIAMLSKAGFTIVLATNQSGINRGLYTLDTLNKIHQKMISMVEKCGGKISGIYFCPHKPDENCECRKPKIGMLLQIQKDFKVKNTDMIFVGDSVKDYEAAEMFGCAFVLVKTGNGVEAVCQLPKIKCFENLLAVAKVFCENRVVNVVFTDIDVRFILADGREISAPLEWFPKLRDASIVERNHWRLIGNGIGVHWPDIDEDIAVKTLMHAGQ